MGIGVVAEVQGLMLFLVECEVLLGEIRRSRKMDLLALWCTV